MSYLHDYANQNLDKLKEYSTIGLTFKKFKN